MTINLSTLPLEIKKKIPISIRALKSEYELNELPSPIRRLVQNYLEESISVQYPVVFDVLPKPSEYGDFKVIKDVKTLVLEYLKNYFLTMPEDYPFDSKFGSRLKRYLQTKDTTLRKQLVENEIDNIVNIIKAELEQDIRVENIKIISVGTGTNTDYNITLDVKINNSTSNFSVVVIS